MKKIILLFIISLIFISCKKKYTCECSTINIQGIGTSQPAYINQETYHVKEKNKESAMNTCAREYEASGMATGGVNCNVTKD